MRHREVFENFFAGGFSIDGLKSTFLVECVEPKIRMMTEKNGQFLVLKVRKLKTGN